MMQAAWSDPISIWATLAALLVVSRIIAPFVDLQPVPVRRTTRTGSAIRIPAGPRRVGRSRVVLGVLLAPVPGSA